jgi:hypothetical protein
MYVLLTLCLAMLATLTSESQSSLSITLKTRTTSTYQDQRGRRIGRTQSESIYIQGTRRRTDDISEAFEIAPANTSSRIEQCDLKRIIFLQHGPHVYDIMPFPDEAAERAWQERRDKALAEIKSGKRKLIPTPPNDAVITFETIDTGERKEIAGFTLRHLKQTQVTPGVLTGGKTGARTETRDGWYLELPNPEGCPAPRLPAGVTTFIFVTLLTSGVDVRPHVQVKGNAPSRLPTAVEEIHTTNDGDGTTWNEKTELVELSRGPVDPKLFELPQGYRPALHTPNGGRDLMRPDTLLNRIQAWWNYYRLRWHTR